MKKLLALFAVFALTAPVFAADGDPNVLITCNDLGGGLVQVSYAILYEDGLDPSARARGFAFNINANNGCLITAISEYDAEGEPVPADKDMIPALYSVYMGSIQFNTQDPNYVTDFGDPIAPSDHIPPYPETEGGLNTSGITVEMGSLYPEGGTQPPASGNLFKIQLTDPLSAGSCHLTITGNDARGQAVLEVGSPANIYAPEGCEVTFACSYVIGQPRYYDVNMNPGPAITQANYDAWVAAGKPACWCCPHHGYGDVNGDGVINPSDVPLVWNPFKLGQSPVRADVNHDGSVNPSDVPLVWNNVKAALGPLPNTCPDCP
jgi:hypothetical protein